MHKLFKTTKVEHERPVEGTVQGDIPDWVNGSLYRNGPGMYEVGEHKYVHLFDPLAMFQRFHVSNKKVTYQNRYLKSDTYKKNMAAQRIVIYGPGTLPVPDPCLNMFQRFLTRFQPEERNDNTNVAFFPMQDEIYATTETNFIHKVDPETLETSGKVNITDYVAVNSVSAHGHWDPDGTLHCIGNRYTGGPKICIIKLPPRQDKTEVFPRGEVMSAIKSSGKVSINYIHSFGITENYYVYVEQPLFMNLLKALTANIRNVPKNTCIEWWPSIPTRFRIIKRSTGEEVNPHFKYEADPAVVIHHINAYEDNGHLVVDLCASNSASGLDLFYLKNLTSEEYVNNFRKQPQPIARRYVLPLDITEETARSVNLVKLQNTTATAERQGDDVIFCTWEKLADMSFEFPQINYNLYNGRKYRFAYGLGYRREGAIFNTVMKIDTESKTYTEWGVEKCYPSEPVFVANPNGVSEDDGVLLVAVNNSDFSCGKNAFLLILDAKSMSEIARVEFNIQRFPPDFHGIFK